MEFHPSVSISLPRCMAETLAASLAGSQITANSLRASCDILAGCIALVIAMTIMPRTEVLPVAPLLPTEKAGP